MNTALIIKTAASGGHTVVGAEIASKADLAHLHLVCWLFGHLRKVTATKGSSNLQIVSLT